MENTFYTYRALVTRVVDGDTFDAEIDLGFDVRITTRIRLYDFDAAETHRPRNATEREHGKLATEWLKNRIEGKQVILVTVKDKSEKYGRMLATVYDNISNDDTIISELVKTECISIQQYMVTEGLAKRSSY